MLKSHEESEKRKGNREPIVIESFFSDCFDLIIVFEAQAEP